MELTIREGSSRVRALLSYAATDFQPVTPRDGGKSGAAGALGGWLKSLSGPSSPQLAASTLELTDIVLTRERLGRRPLDLRGSGERRDALWTSIGEDRDGWWRSSEGEVSLRGRMGPDGEMAWAPPPPPLEGEKWNADRDIGEASGGMFRRLFPGLIGVEAPLLAALPNEDGESSTVAIVLSVPNSDGDEIERNGRIRASVEFALPGRGYVVDQESGKLLSRPIPMTDFFVDRISMLI